MASPDTIQKTKIVANNKAGYLHLLIVYIVWGSTYLAIRVAVRDGSGFTPFVMGAMRVLAASAILLGIGAAEPAAAEAHAQRIFYFTGIRGAAVDGGKRAGHVGRAKG